MNKMNVKEIFEFSRQKWKIYQRCFRNSQNLNFKMRSSHGQFDFYRNSSGQVSEKLGNSESFHLRDEMHTLS